MMERKEQSVSISLMVLLCFNLIHPLAALRCYACQWIDGRGDRECLNSPPPSRFLTECSQPQCWKKYSSYNGLTNVARFCGAVAGERAYCQQSSFENIVRGEIYPATECFCRTEGCNSTSKLYKNYQVILLIVIVVISINHMNVCGW